MPHWRFRSCNLDEFAKPEADWADCGCRRAHGYNDIKVRPAINRLVKARRE